MALENIPSDETLRQNQASLQEAREQLQLALKASQLGIYDYDILAGTHTWDRRSRELWGIGLEEIVTSERFFNGIHPDDRAGTQAANDRAFDPGGTGKYATEYRVINQVDHKVRWVAATGQVYFENGKAIRLVGTVEDITERKRMEQELADSERRFRELVQYAPSAIYEVDFRTLRFTTVNDAMITVSGYSREELLQMSPFDLLDEPSQALLQERTRQWKSGEQPGDNVEYRVKTKDGRMIYAVLNSTFLNDSDGRPRAVMVIAHDITERKRAELAITAAKEEAERNLAQLQTIIQNMDDGLIVSDREGNMLLFNDAMIALTGLMKTPEENFQQYAERIEIHGRDGRIIPIQDWPLARALRGETVRNLEVFVQRHDTGKSYTALYNAAPVFDRSGQVQLCILTVRDITDRKQAEEAIHKSEERFRSSIESLSVGFSILSAVREEGIIVDFRNEYVNEMTCRMGQRTRDQVIGHTLLELFPHFRDDSLFNKYIQVVETGQPLVEQAYAYADVAGMQPSLSGRFDVHAVKFGDGLIVTLDDVTVQVRLEAEHLKAVQEREIHHRLADQREKERQSFARDIHDGPIQTLSSLAFSLQFLKEAYDDPKLQLELSEIALGVKGAVQELRQVMNELRPPNVLRFGLAKAIQVHGETLRERYPQILWNLRLANDEQILEEQTSLALFRVYQEAVNNIIRHSEATKSWITYRVFKGHVTLEIRDNGKGIADKQDIVTLTNHKHFGLAGMSERVQAIQGQMEIISQAGHGTIIKVSVPIMQKEQA